MVVIIGTKKAVAIAVKTTKRAKVHQACREAEKLLYGRIRSVLWASVSIR
jgi:hypothetical protein